MLSEPATNASTIEATHGADKEVSMGHQVRLTMLLALASFLFLGAIILGMVLV